MANAAKGRLDPPGASAAAAAGAALIVTVQFIDLMVLVELRPC